MNAHPMSSWKNLGHTIYGNTDTSEVSVMQAPDALAMQSTLMDMDALINTVSDPRVQPPTVMKASVQRTSRSEAYAWYDLPAHALYLGAASAPCQDGVPVGWYFIPAVTIAFKCQLDQYHTGVRYRLKDPTLARVYGKQLREVTSSWSVSVPSSMLMMNNIYPENNHMCYGSMDLSYLWHCDAEHSIAGRVGIPSVTEISRYWDEFLLGQANRDLRYNPGWSQARLGDTNMSDVAKSMDELSDTSMKRRFYGTFMAQVFFLDAYYPSLASDDPAQKAVRLRLLGKFWDALLNAPVYETAPVQDRLAVFDPRHLLDEEIPEPTSAVTTDVTTGTDEAADGEMTAHGDGTDDTVLSDAAGEDQLSPAWALRDRIIDLVSALEVDPTIADDHDDADDARFIITDDHGEAQFTDRVSLVSVKIMGDDEHRINITEVIDADHRDVGHVATALATRMTMMRLYEPADLTTIIQGLTVGDTHQFLVDNGALILEVDPQDLGLRSNLMPLAG